MGTSSLVGFDVDCGQIGLLPAHYLLFLPSASAIRYLRGNRRLFFTRNRSAKVASAVHYIRSCALLKVVAQGLSYYRVVRRCIRIRVEQFQQSGHFCSPLSEHSVHRSALSAVPPRTAPLTSVDLPVVVRVVRDGQSSARGGW
jgi:hypothetical protein